MRLCATTLGPPLTSRLPILKIVSQGCGSFFALTLLRPIPLFAFHPAVPLSRFSLTTLHAVPGIFFSHLASCGIIPLFAYHLPCCRPHFSTHLPCCALIFLRTYPAVPISRSRLPCCALIIFLRTYPAALSRFTITTYPAVP